MFLLVLPINTIWATRFSKKKKKKKCFRSSERRIGCLLRFGFISLLMHVKLPSAKIRVIVMKNRKRTKRQ